MTLSRALALVLVILPLSPALAQFPGMPGTGIPGSPGMSPGFGAQPQAPPPICQGLLALRDETQKHALALKAAGERKAPPEEACKLFKVFLAAESKMLKGLEEGSQICGIPPDVIKQVKAQHTGAGRAAKQVCDAAAQGPRPTGPTFSDALGATPLPDSANSGKRGMGTFDTLTGSPLGR